MSTSALKITITESFLDTSVLALEPDIEEVLASIEFDDIFGTASTSIGSIDYMIGSISISEACLQDLFLTLGEETNDITIGFEDASITLDFEYSYQFLSWPYLSEEGSGLIAANGMLFEASARVLKNETTGGMYFEVTDTVVSIEDFEVSLDGGILASVVDLFEELFANTINSIIEGILENAVEAMLGAFLEYVNGSALSDCETDICIDMRMAQDMTMSNNAGTFDLGGTFFWATDQSTYVAPTAWPDIPRVINEKAIQYTWGYGTFETYFATLAVAGYFPNITCDTTNGTACNMTVNAPQYLSAEAVAESFPEFAEAYPGSEVSVSVSLSATPVPTILYSAIEVPLEVLVTFAPYDAQLNSTGAAAATFCAMLDTAADVDFTGYHGTSQDTPVTKNRRHVTLELSPYAIEAELATTALASVDMTDALEEWLENVIFETAVLGQWGDNMLAHSLDFLRADILNYVDRVVIYDPDYVSMTVDVEVN